MIDMATDLGGDGREQSVAPSASFSRPAWLAAPWRWLAVLLGLSLGASAPSVFGLPTPWAIVIGIATCLLMLFAFSTVDLMFPPTSESRQRVLEAEAELEEALRPTGRYNRGHWTLGEDELMHADVPLPPLPSRRTPLGLPELWKLTHSRLDHYHETVLGQARRSFRSAQLAMWIGFLLLGGFVWVAVKASTTAGSVVAGGLGAVSAALAGYVSRTFVKSQEAAASHLRAYFDQPLMFSRFLAAERLLQDGGLAEEKRAEVLGALVLAMAADPKASPGEDKPASPPA